MSRTRQPSTRRIGAAERAIAVLDTLAEAGELGTNEIARRTGMTPEHRIASARDARRLRSRRARRRDGPLSPRPADRAPRERAPRPARRARGRATASRRARRGDRRDRDAVGAGRRGRDHGRLRPGKPPRAAGVAARPALDRARDLGGQGHARLLGARASRRRRCARTRPERSRTRRRSRREIAQRARARVGAGRRRARAGPGGHRGARTLEPGRARGDRRAPGPELPLRRAGDRKQPCRSSSSAPTRSHASSAGARD